MLFNSLDFAIFLPIVFVLYWFVTNKNLKLQNLLIVLASYVFYGWWDWRFLSLIVFSTLVDYTIGRRLGTEDKERSRKILLYTSIAVNLGFLGFFKYYNFFLDNFIQAFSFFGQSIEVRSLNIILPVGISFYTFQTLSYTIDVYNRKLEPTKDLIAFSAFVSFFPQLVAGPIERATNLLPQFFSHRTFDLEKAKEGLRQILWGLFKKVVIADQCAVHVNEIFGNYQEYSGSTLIVGAIFFSFQIYGDFSGYSDIAIGTSRLFGFNLMQNFAFPYFSRDIAEFWRRWHISLSTWFRDYVYIPLGGSKGGLWMKIRNTLVIFIVSGFWHGANWTFIAWGAINGLLFLPLLIANKNRKFLSTSISTFPSLKEFTMILSTFGLTTLAWVFFRSENIQSAIGFLGGILSLSSFSLPSVRPSNLFVLILLFIFMEWRARDKEFALESISNKLTLIPRYFLYSVLSFLILFNLKFHDKSEFIYFQF